MYVCYSSLVLQVIALTKCWMSIANRKIIFIDRLIDILYWIVAVLSHQLITRSCSCCRCCSSLRFFHGFARHSNAVEELKGKPSYFLVRYSESQLKDGFFAFNVNKGNSFNLSIYQYIHPIHPSIYHLLIPFNVYDHIYISTGNSYRDVIENYSIRYDADQQAFLFRDKAYKTLRDFINDPEYSHILRYGLPKTTVETIKESNYRSATDLVT